MQGPAERLHARLPRDGSPAKSRERALPTSDVLTLSNGSRAAEIIPQLRLHASECFFWRTHQGAELDLLVVRGRQRIRFEIKHTPAPVLTPSMRLAVTDLKLDALYVIHAGAHAYAMADRIRAVPAAELVDVLATVQ